MGVLDRERGGADSTHSGSYVTIGWIRQWQPSKTVLDCLPHAVAVRLNSALKLMSQLGD